MAAMKHVGTKKLIIQHFPRFLAWSKRISPKCMGWTSQHGFHDHVVEIAAATNAAGCGPQIPLHCGPEQSPSSNLRLDDARGSGWVAVSPDVGPQETCAWFVTISAGLLLLRSTWLFALLRNQNPFLNHLESMLSNDTSRNGFLEDEPPVTLPKRRRVLNPPKALQAFYWGNHSSGWHFLFDISNHHGR